MWRSSTTITIRRSDCAVWLLDDVQPDAGGSAAGAAASVGGGVRHLVEGRDLLRLLPIEDGEVVGGQPLDRMAVLVHDHDVDLDQFDAGAERRLADDCASKHAARTNAASAFMTVT